MNGPVFLVVLAGEMVLCTLLLVGAIHLSARLWR